VEGGSCGKYETVEDKKGRWFGLQKMEKIVVEGHSDNVVYPGGSFLAPGH